MKKLSGYEGAHGNFRETQEDAASEIIGAAGWGDAKSAISGGNIDINVVRLRDAILWAADAIRKTQKRSAAR